MTPRAVEDDNSQLMIVDEMQKSVIEKIIDCEAYTDGFFVDFDDLVDLTEKNSFFSEYCNGGDK